MMQSAPLTALVLARELANTEFAAHARPRPAGSYEAHVRCQRGSPRETQLHASRVGASRSIFEGSWLDYWMSNVDAACAKNDLMQFVFGTAGCGRGEPETTRMPVLFPDHS
jgi:hypothetical protein